MEMTTPPNRSGFNRKPKSKKRYSGSRKTNTGKSDSNFVLETSSEATAWLYGTMFLVVAAQLLAPFMSHVSKDNPATTVKTD